MVDQSKVGLTDEPSTMPIERGKIREFARSCKTNNPAYVEERGPVAPPTFLTTVNFWAGGGKSPMQRLDIDLRRLLHGGQEYVFHGPPPRAGTKLTVTSHVAERYEKQGSRGGTMTFTVSVQEFRDESGRLVAEGRTTSILTSKPTTE